MGVKPFKKKMLQNQIQKPIQVKTLNKQSVVIRVTLLSLVLITVYCFMTLDYKDTNVFEGIVLTVLTFKTAITEAHFKHFTFWEGFYKVLVTFGLAFLTTLFGAVISLFLGLFAAQNLSSKGISNTIRGCVAFIRSVPTVLWVLFFAISAGLGSVAAVIGMTFHTVGYLVKAYSESFEEIDHGVIEALKASGAGWWQIAFQGVIPSCMTYLISWTFLRLEINFAVAIAMGAAAGAGGIGYDMFMASLFYYDLREVGTIILFILVFAVALELIAIRLKRNLRVSL